MLDDGVNSLSQNARQAIKNADRIIGGSRVLKLFEHEIKGQCEPLNLDGSLAKVSTWVKESLAINNNVVVLATGDPLCHGIGSYLVKVIGADLCEIIPNVSNIQLACAKLGLSWHDIKISSVHAKDAGEWEIYADSSHGLYTLLQDLKQNHKLVIFTSPENTPDRIARMMLMEGLEENFHCAVMENLLSEQEKTHQLSSVSELSQRTYQSPNILLIWSETPANNKPFFGYSDDYFHQRKPGKGLITKCEVRVVSLAKMQICKDSIVWDIGAGSGSVGLEAAIISSKGHVYAIEKNENDLKNIEQNRLKMNIVNYSLFHGKALQFIDRWQNPDAIFIGGSGGELAELIKRSLERLKVGGWLVMNFVTFENLSLALRTLKEHNAEWDVTQLQISRSQPILHMNRLSAENPVWIVSTQAMKSEL